MNPYRYVTPATQLKRDIVRAKKLLKYARAELVLCRQLASLDAELADTTTAVELYHARLSGAEPASYLGADADPAPITARHGTPEVTMSNRN